MDERRGEEGGLERQLFFALVGYRNHCPASVLSDLSDWQTAKILGVKPWELDEVPLFWIERAGLFERALNDAQIHLAKRR